MVNNWLFKEFGFLLRDEGNTWPSIMMAKDSVKAVWKQRFRSPNFLTSAARLRFFPLVQTHHNVRLQMGSSDQSGEISQTELICPGWNRRWNTADKAYAHRHLLQRRRHTKVRKVKPETFGSIPMTSPCRYCCWINQSDDCKAIQVFTLCGVN
jgi:hypothetical protein